MMLRYLTSLIVVYSLIAPASAITFQRVVALGDSLFDDTSGTRGPVAAEHIAHVLDAPLTNLARSGATSSDLLSQGQHTTAAAQFGAGDLAVLWIGGNDFFQNSLSIAFGQFGFLNTLEANVGVAMSTLRNAGLEVVALNLLDMSRVPVIQNLGIGLGNFRTASQQWRTRLNNLAASHQAAVVDVFNLFDQLVTNPQQFSILGNTPVLGPTFGCSLCVFADNAHPSSLSQGFVSNASLVTMNQYFDPNGAMPLPLLSHVQLANLANILAGDFNQDGLFGINDIDALVDEIANMSSNLAFDLSGDRVIDIRDLDIWRAVAGAANLPNQHPYQVADANLDGAVDGTDFNLWNSWKFTTHAKWSRGDFNADGFVDGSDYNLWNSFKFTSADPFSVAVPEPLSTFWPITILLSLVIRHRHVERQRSRHDDRTVRRRLISPADVRMISSKAIAMCTFLWIASQGIATVWSDDPFRYPEGQFGTASLKYVRNLPVLEVRGTPAEIGEQVAKLALGPARQILDYPQDFLRQANLQVAWPLLRTACLGLAANIPDDYRQELESIASSSGQPGDLLLVANTMFDVMGGLGCSTLIVPSSHSATDAPLFGRNLDFPTLGYLNEYSLVVIYHPNGKRSFAAVTFPGCMGVLTGINDAGLTVAVLEVYESRDQSLKFNPMGTPYALCFRRILEECATVEEAEQALRGMSRTNWLNLAICDRQRGAVFEITPQTVAVRTQPEECLACTNHFRTVDLGTDASHRCWRFPVLQGNGDNERLGLQDVHNRLHRANQGDLTLQTMIFEPAKFRLHLAIGPTPTSALPLQTITLTQLQSRATFPQVAP